MVTPEVTTSDQIPGLCGLALVRFRIPLRPTSGSPRTGLFSNLI